MNDLVLIGAGGHARACIDVVEAGGDFRIACIVGTSEALGSTCLGHTVEATDEELDKLAANYAYALIAVGQIGSAATRLRLYERAITAGFSMPAVVSPRAYVSPHARLGPGTIVMHGAIVNAGAELGENCIINSRALIEHDAWVDSHCHIATGATLNGGVRIGAESFVGSGAIVREGITLGERSIVGMGACVRHDLPGQSRHLGGR